MALIITPERVAALWDALRAWPPFSGWRLPPAESVRFRCTGRREVYGEHIVHINGDHEIVISSRNVGHWDTLTMWLAHEAIHCHQAKAGLTTRGVEHNADFRRKALAICRDYGWDPHLFS